MKYEAIDACYWLSNPDAERSMKFLHHSGFTTAVLNGVGAVLLPWRSAFPAHESLRVATAIQLSSKVL